MRSQLFSLAAFLAMVAFSGETAAQSTRATSVDTSFRIAYEALKKGDFTKAAEGFEQGVSKSPQDALGHYYLARAYFGLGRQFDATREFKKSLELDSDSTVAVDARQQLLLLQRGGASFAVDMRSRSQDTSNSDTTICDYDVERHFRLQLDESGIHGRLIWSSRKVSGTTKYYEDDVKKDLWSDDDQRQLDSYARSSKPSAAKRYSDQLQAKSEAAQTERQWKKDCFQDWSFTSTSSIDVQGSNLFVTILESTNSDEVGAKKGATLEFLEDGALARLVIPKDWSSSKELVVMLKRTNR